MKKKKVNDSQKLIKYRNQMMKNNEKNVQYNSNKEKILICVQSTCLFVLSVNKPT